MTDGHIDWHQFRKQSSKGDVLPPCQISYQLAEASTFYKFEFANQNVDRWTDVRHINLIGTLVTSNPSNNQKINHSSVYTLTDLKIDCGQEIWLINVLVLLEIFFSFFFLSADFHELWHSMMSTCFITEVKEQWTTLVLGWATV